MLIYFSDAVVKQPVAINPKHVTAVFTISEGEYEGKTAIGISSGNLIVNESQDEVVGHINGALKK